MSMSHDEMIAVIAAHKDGHKLQWRFTGESEGEWRDFLNEPTWAFQMTDYRVKPEPPKPREWWIFPMAHGEKGNDLYELGTQERAINMGGVIHVREVMD